MPRTANVDKNGMKKGPWSKEEDDKLRAYIQRYGHWNWREIPRFAGVSRCGKSCRLRWMNYLRPNMKHGNFTKEEEDLIMELHNKMGNRWAKIAAKLPGRSDNEIKNYWHTHLKKNAKEDQNLWKNACDEEILNTNYPNRTKNSTENADLEAIDEVEAIWASLSSEISSETISASTSSSSSVDITSSIFSDPSDCLVSCGDSFIYPYNNQFDDVNFWTDDFVAADYDGIRSGDYSSDLELINSLMAPAASCQEMGIISDDFLRSTMDLYAEYPTQSIN